MVLSPVLFAYTGNLIRLEDGTKLLSPTPRRRHSTPKPSSARSNLSIFATGGGGGGGGGGAVFVRR